MTVGEDNHRKGEDGTRRARRWLDATTRVAKSWTNADRVAVGRLSFEWPYGGQPFSFDLGGIMRGDTFDNQLFVAESKMYDNARDQGTHYDKFVAQCYVLSRDHPRLADHYMYITWSPFRADNWSDQLTEKAVVDGLLKPKNRKRVFDLEGEDEARALIDTDVVKQVADKLWLIVLSDKQEELVVSKKHRGWILQRETEEEDV
ncbi:hypothetical protein [Blastococcus sp. TF02A-26]|uniref:hypothetical protein n=1 Tax=Blastococcus sp. TF02A-26 TaxID=2250577 RepID=UPI0011BE3108|nr:hypothetical protein [Blastococcus sp. TF02A-26]